MHHTPLKCQWLFICWHIVTSWKICIIIIKIICESILMWKQVWVQMWQSTEFWPSLLCGMNPKAYILLLPPLQHNCSNYCRWTDVHAGRNSAPDKSPQVLVSDHFDSGWLPFVSSVWLVWSAVVCSHSSYSFNCYDDCVFWKSCLITTITTKLQLLTLPA